VRQKLYEYLRERPAGASSRELLELMFTQPGADPDLGPRVLRGMLGDDARFVWRDTEQNWHAHDNPALARSLADTSFVVVDLETTGLSATATGIIEIGAARVQSGRIVETFEELVNPGTRLPPFITRLTGIDDGMLKAAPPIDVVWPRFRAFLGMDVIVAHNASFDLGFLNAAATALDGGVLPQPHLCTLKLARRLLPQLRRRGLDALAAHFGIPQVDRHRALGDVRITVEVLFQLLERLAVRGVTRLDQTLDLQGQARDGRPFVCPLPRARVEQLPAAPGVYRFFSAEGRLLYVGKAADLRERVRSERGIRFIYVDRHDTSPLAIIEAVNALRRNEILALLGDRDGSSHTAPMEFFGLPADIPLGAAYLGLASGAPVFPVFVPREGSRYATIMEEPVWFSGGHGSHKQVIEEGTARILRVFERYIRAYPDQWYNFFDYWGVMDGRKKDTTCLKN